ncbi:MAG: M14 family zinc carboxypeptidase [Pseudomonadota bacterium]
MNFIELKAGMSVDGREIQAFRSESKASSYIYLISGVHGDEVEAVYVMQQLFEWLKKNDDVTYPIITIPIFNVDGYNNGSRTNAHGVDLNRNLPSKHWVKDVKEKKNYPGTNPLSEPENKYLVKLFEKYPPAFILSFHAWKPMLNYNGACLDIAQFISRYNSYPVEADVGYPTPGSLGELGPEEYKAPVLTYECPPLTDEKGLKEIWEENQHGLINLLKSDQLNKFLNN